MKMIDGWRHAGKLRSVQTAGLGTLGAIAGAIASALAASGTAFTWVGFIPMWAVWAGAAVIGSLTIFFRVTQQKSAPPCCGRRRWR